MRRAVMVGMMFGAMAVVGPLLAQPQVVGDPRFAPPPPPPGLGSPGVKVSDREAAVADKAAAARKRAALSSAGPATPASLTPSRMHRATPVISDPAHPKGAPVEPPPEVKVSKQGDKTVQQYSRNGQVYMVVVTPKYGPPQTYYVPAKNPGTTGSNTRGNLVAPPMYTLFRWGEAPPPADTQDAAP